MPSFMCMPWSCNRQIDSLDRRQCNLQQIPGDIERYARSLEELLLDMNHIRDLPKSLFRMSKLQRLGLSDNDIHRLPPEVAALQNLIELNLSRNDISDLPEDLKVCQNLQLLDISSNPIARLPDSITLCTSLTQLSLNDISLTKLPQDIGKLVLLKSLEVRENHLRALPASISELSQLQRLDLGQNELDELLNEIGSLRSLVELYVDENSLERLPDALLQCGRLEQLDASSNRLFQLPDELGDLGCLVDLTVSHNCLRELPNSIGRLKRLFILKADDNTIDALTPAIGGCTALNELYLQQNLIGELPSSIGNLRFLQTLNLDRCQLHRLPALIGECQSLTVLSLRDNQLEELPMEIGKLARLRVLDVCNNRIAYLPYTINVLRELQALWISENQSQALLRFQPDTDPRTGIKVLTCYLLPQESVAETKPTGNGAPPQANKTGFVGGPKVHFGADEEHEETAAGTSGSADGKAAQFERKNTPHPKPSVGSASGGAAAAAAAKHHKTKQQVDGHILPRMDEHPKQLVLNSTGKKISHDHSSSHSHTSEPSSSAAAQKQPPNPMPRSALKYSSRAIIQQQQSQQNAEGPSSSSATHQQQQQKQSSEQQQQKTVFFTNSTGQANTAGTETDSPVECRLKRVNTPHYKSQRAAAKSTTNPAASQQQQNQPQNRRQLPSIPNASDQQNAIQSSSSKTSPRQSQTSIGYATTQFPTDGMPIKDQQGKPNASVINNNNSVRTESPSSTAAMERKRIIVRRDPSGQQSGGLGLSIAGGIESTPFIENDPGLFISKLVPGGAAEKAGVRVGDKVLEINGSSMIGRRHQVAVDAIQQRADGVELLIQRKGEQKQTTPSNSTTSPPSASVPTPMPISLPSASTPTNPSIRTVTPSQLTNTSFSSLPATTQQQQSKLPYAADLPYGDPKLDGQIEEIHLVRDSKHSLGLSIVGGIDHCSHPFGSSAQPGVFISKITTNSPAELSRRLRIGDRILKVNDADISTAKHNEAVEALKNTGRSLRLTICHEPQPKGLRSVVVHRREQQPLGLSICGGIGSSPMNPNDRTDEGIFIERVEKGGPSDQSCVGLSIGDRVLEVNDDSLLGCTKEEAAQIFRRASQGQVRLLICEGFSINSTANSTSRPQMATITVSATSPIASNKGSPPNKQQTSPPNTTIGLGLINSPPPMKQQNGENQHHEYQNLIEIGTTSPPNKNNGNNYKDNEGNAQETPPMKTTNSPAENNALGGQIELKRTESIERSGVTTFSTQPPRDKNPSGERNGGNNSAAAKIPPPVAPKPRLNITSFSDQPNNDLNNSATNFSTRLRQFEQQQQMAAPAIPQMPPSKRPLLNNEDLAKLAEDDRMRQLLKKNNGNEVGTTMKENGGGRNDPPDGISPMSPTAPFEHILLNESPVVPFQTVSSIRTKKAENRFLQQQRQNNSTSPSSATIVNQMASEQQRRSEWRQARMASLEAESKRVGQLISDVNEISKMSLIEERQHQSATSAGGGGENN